MGAARARASEAAHAEACTTATTSPATVVSGNVCAFRGHLDEAVPEERLVERHCIGDVRGICKLNVCVAFRLASPAVAQNRDAVDCPACLKVCLQLLGRGAKVHISHVYGPRVRLGRVSNYRKKSTNGPENLYIPGRLCSFPFLPALAFPAALPPLLPFRAPGASSPPAPASRIRKTAIEAYRILSIVLEHGHIFSRWNWLCASRAVLLRLLLFLCIGHSQPWMQDTLVNGHGYSKTDPLALLLHRTRNGGPLFFACEYYRYVVWQN